MIIITDANGNLQAPTIAENIYQGSNKANSIVFLSPLAQSNTATIMFRLPSGLLTPEYLMTPYDDVPSQYDLNAWVRDIDSDITALYGTVTYQIKLTNANGTVITSVSGTFNVLRGVAPLPSTTPSTTNWNEVLAYLAQINGDIENGWLVSKGILPYDETFSYPINASVWNREDSTIYTSLVDENIGNPLTDTTKWSAKKILTSSEYEELRNLLQQKVNKITTSGNKTGQINNINGSIIMQSSNGESGDLSLFGVDAQFISLSNGNLSENKNSQLDITKNGINYIKNGTSGEIARISDIEETAEELRQSIQAVDNKLGDCTEENPAADKDFVNSTIQTATANFRGNWEDFASVPADAEEYPLDFAQSRTPTVNDYIAIADAGDYHSEEIFTREGETTGYYISADGTITANADFAYSAELELDDKDKALTLRATGTSGRFFRIHCYDENHNWIQEVISGQSTGELVLYGTLPERAKYVRVSYPQAAADGIELYTHLTLGSWRFKYTGNWDIQGKAGWEPEYQLNETPFTMAQLATLNSGLTADDKLMVATSSRLGGLYFWIDEEGIPNISTTPRPAFINEQTDGEVIMRGAFEAIQTDSTVILQ